MERVRDQAGEELAGMGLQVGLPWLCVVAAVEVEVEAFRSRSSRSVK
jgi:hypothetical protein